MQTLQIAATTRIGRSRNSCFSAKYWIEKAAAKGNPDAHYVIYQYEWDKKNALSHLKIAAESKEIPAAEYDFARKLDDENNCTKIKAARYWALLAQKAKLNVLDVLNSIKRHGACCHVKGIPWPTGEKTSKQEFAPQVAEDYANGENGKSQNFDLALKVICNGDDMSPFERDQMINYVLKMRAEPNLPPLRYCDFASSGETMAYCQTQDASKSQRANENSIATISMNWPLPARKALNRLMPVANDYFKAESYFENDTYRGGSEQASQIIGDEDDLKTEFTKQLKKLANQSPKVVSNDRLKIVERQLNAIVKEKFSMGDTASQKLLTNAQNEWIAYRNMWANLYVALWTGKLDATSAKTRADYDLTRLRIYQLKDVDVVSEDKTN